MKQVLFLALLITGVAYGQQVSPRASQTSWPNITGSGTPTAPCTSANYGQPYQNTAVTPNTVYTCGTDGWAIRGGDGGTITGSGTTGSVPLFTPNGTTLGNSHLDEVTTPGVDTFTQTVAVQSGGVKMTLTPNFSSGYNLFALNGNSTNSGGVSFQADGTGADPNFYASVPIGGVFEFRVYNGAAFTNVETIGTTGATFIVPITAPNVAVSALTSTRIPKAGTGGLLSNSGITDQGTLLTLSEPTIYSSTLPTLSSCTGGTVSGGSTNAFHISGISSATTCTATFPVSLSGVCVASAYGSGGAGILIGVVSNSASVTFNITVLTTDINATCF